jgi:hypothetical protein
VVTGGGGRERGVQGGWAVGGGGGGAGVIHTRGPRKLEVAGCVATAKVASVQQPVYLLPTPQLLLMYFSSSAREGPI